jgi:hypothetical protein
MSGAALGQGTKIIEGARVHLAGVGDDDDRSIMGCDRKVKRAEVDRAARGRKRLD